MTSRVKKKTNIDIIKMSGCWVCIIMLITSTVKKKWFETQLKKKEDICYFVNNASHTFFLSPTF